MSNVFRYVLSSGESFAGCRILSFCGHGGAGVVYLALDAMNRKVALKLIPICDAKYELEGIRRYIRAATGKKNLIQIYHAGIENDILYYIMEAADCLENAGHVYIPKTLSAILNKQGRLPAGQALELVRGVACGLECLHAAKLIHCDVKPENIVYINGIPKLCDPGLVSSMEASISFAGTLGYLPQECFEGHDLNSPGRDIYALGKVFYIAVTGELPSRYPSIPGEISFSVRRNLWPVLIRVCASNPRHRFKTVRAFCDALPASLPSPSFWENKMESFRLWRMAHPDLMILNLILCSLLLLLCGCGVGCYIYHVRKQESMVSQAEIECRKYAAQFKSCWKSLQTQLEGISGKANAQEIDRLYRHLAANPLQRVEQYKRLDLRLKREASRFLPEIPDKEISLTEAYSASDKIRGILESPLSRWLPMEQQKKIQIDLARFERKYFDTPFNKLHPGKPFLIDSSYRTNFIYVPPGAYRAKNGNVVIVDHSVWCCDGELRNDMYSSAMNIAMPYADPAMPAIRLTWNDVINYCYLQTLQLQRRAVLPPGYIMRPLTVHEWQWACQGAWRGIGHATAFNRTNSKGRAHPGRSGEPNNLGLFDMVGNVSELVIPEPESPDRRYEVLNCGGDFETEEPTPWMAQRILIYQFLALTVGTRLAIAPGNMDFFDKQLRVTESRHWVHDRIHYELLATNELNMSLQAASDICDLLGCTPASVDNDILIDRLTDTFFELGSFPTLVGGSYQGGRWIRPDGKIFSLKNMPKVPKQKKWMLSLYGKRLNCFISNKVTGVLCQWTEQEYTVKRIHRERLLKSRCVLHRFEEGGKTYCLIRIGGHTHSIRRIAQLTGGCLAEPRTEQLRSRMQRELARWHSRSILLGGYWKFDHWAFFDGTDSHLEFPFRGKIILNSKNCAAPGLRNNQFCSLESCDAFLLELPAE